MPGEAAPGVSGVGPLQPEDQEMAASSSIADLFSARANVPKKMASAGAVLEADAHGRAGPPHPAAGWGALRHHLLKGHSHVGGSTEHEEFAQSSLEQGRAHHHVNTLGKFKAVARFSARYAMIKHYESSGSHRALAVAAVDAYHDELHKQASGHADSVPGEALGDLPAPAAAAELAKAQEGQDDGEGEDDVPGHADLTWLLNECLHILHLDGLMPPSKRDKRRVMGKYRSSSLLGIETLWLWTLGFTAEVLANVMVCLAFDKLPEIDRVLRKAVPTPIDTQLTVLNLSGAFLDGAAVYLAKWHLEFHDPPLLLVFRSGFCSVWTTLAGVVEHAAALPPFLGVMYLGAMVLLGAVANEAGRLCMQGVAVPLLVANGVLKHRKHILCINLSETFWDDLLFYACMSLVVLGATVCRADLVAYNASELLTGCLCVPLSFLFGAWVEGEHEWPGVQWGTWRCNTASYVFLVLASLISTYIPTAATYAVHRRICATFCGALSSFNGLSGDTIELCRRRQWYAACCNTAVNYVTAFFFLFLLRAIPWLDHELQQGSAPQAMAHTYLAHVQDAVNTVAALVRSNASSPLPWHPEF
eukprot:Tamp_09163.p1 GENE.Tamp_09163~~Tamp_09163.p1  ORF type:complete len:587 (-),score=62.50 Tamp_09163:458-2218(-)